MVTSGRMWRDRRSFNWEDDMSRHIQFPLAFLLSLISVWPTLSYGQNPPRLSPKEAKSVLSALGVSYDQEAFFKAVEEDDVRVVRLFHLAGLDVNVKTAVYGHPALYQAVNFGSYKVFRYFLENGVDVNAASEWNGTTALVRAISHRRYEMVYALLNSGALAVRTGLGRGFSANLPPATPLEYALLKPDPVLVKALLEKAASVKERYAWGATPLMSAAGRTSAAVVKILLNAGASVQDVDKWGNTVLFHALNLESQKPQFDILRLLCEAGANVNHVSKSGLFPVAITAYLGHDHVTRLLLQYGADPNKVYRAEKMSIPMIILRPETKVLSDAITGGVTPLMLAAFLGHRDVVETLLQNGADSTIVVHGQQGQHTAGTLALKGGHEEVANTIRSFSK